MRQAPLMD